MIVTLGKRPPSGDAVDLLLECHQRIRSQLALARRGGDATRYFREALPLHVADEDELITLHLAGRDPAIDAAIATMTAQHRAMDPDIERLIAGDLFVLDALDAAFADHLALEESVLFPAMRALGPDILAGVQTAMRRRRGG